MSKIYPRTPCTNGGSDREHKLDQQIIFPGPSYKYSVTKIIKVITSVLQRSTDLLLAAYL